jgi:2-phospho-L-lactate transferase/gluconeogenesis factor (CofD/UPF0052 family)
MPERSLSVVVFSGGRGSSVLSRELITNPRIDLTLAINGYDDGRSTGEVRRFFGDALGPSDFRKNASHLAGTLHTCDESVVALLDRRLSDGTTTEAAIADLASIGGEIGARVATFIAELRSSGKAFDFADCAVGNLAFAGCYLRCGRHFNSAVDDYCSLLNLPAGLIDNVSDGTNAFLVAIDPDDRLLASEADIVDANRRNRIKDIFLLASRPTPADIGIVESLARDQVAGWLRARERQIPVNPRLVARVATADLIVYSPGTQHSSLFPSYLTHGLSRAIAGNLRALKLLITNIQSDAELADATAVDIVQRAVYYLREKGQLPISTPFLITHYLFNDPRGGREEAPYVPLGRLDTLEDPRLVRISNYEDGVTGRHDAAKVLTPFLQAFLADPVKQRIAMLLYDSGSRSKVTQSLLELVRAGLAQVPAVTEVFYGGEKIDEEFTARFPFPVRYLGTDQQAAADFKSLLGRERFDYAVLFESSGMYNGEDAVTIVAQLASGRLDAIWGSRRLSMRDIDASLRLRYRHKAGLRAASAIGSHLLSAAYLLLYGRYISDTLSGVRGVRAALAAAPDLDLNDKRLNQRLLSRLLRDRAEVLETPVRFYAISPERVRRTTVGEGVASLASIVWSRFRK